MSSISPNERLLRALNKKSVDRPPVICPGGMMNAAIVEVMKKTSHTLPAAHHDTQLMTALSKDVQELTGFENFGIPFCMTVEAEVLGSEINFGTLTCEPKIEKEAFPSVLQVEYRKIDEALKSGRIETILQAGYALSKKHPDVPLIGSLTGPISTAGSLIDPMTFLKQLRKEKDQAHRAIDYVTDFLIEYARLLVDNGAKVISIADPTATGEILGPKMFEEYGVRYLNRIIEAVHRLGAPVIVHICGNINSIQHQVSQIQADAVSADANVNLRALKAAYPELTTMGNLSTFLIEFSSPPNIIAQTERLLRDQIDIIAPACGLSTSSSLKNITAMTDTVKHT